jgi:hypothetical protein
MILLLIILSLIITFFVSFFSPRHARKIQKLANHHTGTLKHASNWFWGPITSWLKATLEFFRKLVIRVTVLGKKVRIKFPF